MDYRTAAAGVDGRILSGFGVIAVCDVWSDKNEGKIKRGDFLAWRLICAGRWVKLFDVQISKEN